jgi:hypothetical protein
MAVFRLKAWQPSAQANGLGKAPPYAVQAEGLRNADPHDGSQIDRSRDSAVTGKRIGYGWGRSQAFSLHHLRRRFPRPLAWAEGCQAFSLKTAVVEPTCV